MKDSEGRERERESERERVSEGIKSLIGKRGSRGHRGISQLPSNILSEQYEMRENLKGSTRCRGSQFLAMFGHRFVIERENSGARERE